MGMQDGCYDLENRLRILRVTAVEQNELLFDVGTAWTECGPWLWSQLDVSERAEAGEYASVFARLLYRRRKSIKNSAGYLSACWREESGSPQGKARAFA